MPQALGGGGARTAVPNYELRDSLTHYKMPSLKQACLAKNRGGWRLNLVRIGEIMFTCYIPLLFLMRVVGVR